MSPWLQNLEGEVVEPMRRRIMAHPLLNEGWRGELPRHKLRKMLSDTLWSIVAFPHYIAALAARAPLYDWEVKEDLFSNLYSERSHPHELARAVRALGDNPDSILNGPESAYQPVEAMIETHTWVQFCLFQRPWIEGIAMINVGVEAVVPGQIRPLGRALRDSYGVKEEDLGWFDIHGGDIEEGHGADGYKILDRHVRAEDTEAQERCRAAVLRTTQGRLNTLDAWYAWRADR